MCSEETITVRGCGVSPSGGGGGGGGGEPSVGRIG